MNRCANCGRVNNPMAGRCAGCGAESPVPGALLETFASELSCPSCRTALPPASLFCGVCGASLATRRPLLNS